jgi:lysophospholipase L1-like esterase
MSQTKRTLEDRFSVEAGCRFFAGISLFVWGLVWFHSDADSISRLVGSLLACHAGFVTLFAWQKTALRRGCHVAVGVGLLLAFTARVRWDDPFIIWPEQPKLIACLYLGASAIVGSLGLMGIRPLKVTLVLAILVTGVAVGVMARPRVFSVAHENVPVFHSSWSGGRYQEESHFTGHRRSTMYLYYPDDPRREFETERTSGPIRLESMAVAELSGGRGRRVSSLADHDLLRVVVDQPSPANPWKVLVYRIVLDLRQGDQWLLRARMRADRPRRVHVVLKNTEQPNEAMGLEQTFHLSSDWKEYEFPLTVTKTAATGRLEFEIGDSDVPVEWSEIVWQAVKVNAKYPRSRFVVRHVFHDEGYRTPNVSVEKLPGVFRIVCLGDSMTFGQGASEGTEFPRVLERLMTARANGNQRVEVMNFGICGLDTHQERLVYEHAASKYRPDLVLLLMFKNDDTPPVSVNEDLPEFATMPEGFLARLHDSKAREGYKRCLKQLMLLKRDCQRDGCPLAVVLINTIDDPDSRELAELLKLTSKDLELPILDTHAGFSAYQLSYEDSVVHRIDGHFSKKAHQAMAEVIDRWLLEQHLVAANASEKKMP